MLLALLASSVLTLLFALLLLTLLRIQHILPSQRCRPHRRRTPPDPEPSPSRPYTLAPTQNGHGYGRRRRQAPRRSTRRADKAARDAGLEPTPYARIVIVLGSGGHSAEMLLLLRDLPLERWERRTYLFSAGDPISAAGAADLEGELREGKGGRGGVGDGSWDIVEVPRARRVHQPLWTAPWTSALCLWAALRVLAAEPPDIVLTNGPGTGVVVVLAGLVLRFFGVAGSQRTRAVYVESLARCRKLSLSGWMLRPLVDRFLVQWEQLLDELGRDGAAASATVNLERRNAVECKGHLALDAAIALGMRGVGELEEEDIKDWLTYKV